MEFGLLAFVSAFLVELWLIAQILAGRSCNFFSSSVTGRTISASCYTVWTGFSFFMFGMKIFLVLPFGIMLVVSF